MSTTDLQRAHFADLARAAYAASGVAPSAEMVAAAARNLARLADPDDGTPISDTGVSHTAVLQSCADV